MERTGHRSIEGVRSYKRTSDSQQEALSDILNGPKRPKSATNSSSPATSVFSSTQQSQQLNLSSATSRTAQLTSSLAFLNAILTEKLPSIVDSRTIVYYHC